ncbi:TIR domain-containing protein [Agrobacterium sp. Azo12]|uniref:TIR domain-containing protein n=1 Tax=Agrobacterium sp. Azo12 TaxID=3031129 RepID=UPI0023D7B992|nr:TIR domain-containing protein [Agrobacterium sp. Azo12]MDO5895546.1 TIR domain-containing protein [Agrobacterium sp. Azo12]
MARRTFLSFHYKNDNWRVSQIKQMGVIEEQPLLSANKWEEVEKAGEAAIKKWIDDNLSGKSCLIVLIGEKTAGRKWVDYEIKSAFDAGKGVLGVYIHNLKDSGGNKSPKGTNPFDKFTVGDNPLTKWAKVYNPPQTDSSEVYKHIKDNLASWVETAINLRG